MHSVEKGRVAEAKTVAVLISQRIEVFLPAFGNGTCDLIAVVNGQLVRVEVKYSSSFEGKSYSIGLRQIRFNRSELVAKKYNANKSDVLAAYLATLDKVIFLSSISLHDKSEVVIHPSKVDGLTSFLTALEGEPTGV